MTDSNKYSNTDEPFQIDNGIWKKVFEPNSKNNEDIIVGRCLINLDDLE
jgi:poly-D-alanine transfer protein DltD